MHNFLPFDIICEIFSHYQRGEDDFHPLETLLLVCKSWAAAALSYRVIWGRYKIRLGHKPTMKMWRTRLPLRLMKSGDAHIEIDISTEMDGENDPQLNAQFYAPKCLGDGRHGRSFWLCDCSSEHESLVSWVLDLLAGPNGRGCERWRSLRFHANIYFMDFGPPSASRSLFKALANPTPSLVSLHLHRVSSSDSPAQAWPFVPFAPRLEDATFGDCCLPQELPLLKYARRIEISNARHLGTNLLNLSGAERVEQLLLYNVEVAVPLELPRLRYLSLTGWRVIAAFQPRAPMPQLTCLSLDPLDHQVWQTLTGFDSLPFQQLKNLEIRSRSPSHPTLRCNHPEDSVFKVIRSSINLSSIAISPLFFGVMFKWFLQSGWMAVWAGSVQLDPSNQRKRLMLLSLSGHLLGELSGDETPAQLDSLTHEWGCHEG